MVTILSSAPPAPNRGTDLPPDYVSKANTFMAYMEALPDDLNTWLADVTALVSGTDFNDTSTTSNDIGTGSKSWTVSTGKLWQVGQKVIISQTSATANFLYGTVTSYSSTTLQVNVTYSEGSGTGITDWSIGLAPVASNYLALSGGTLTGPLTTATPASGQEALIIPHGAAPSAPTNGSIWTTTAAIFARLNGVTQTLLTLAGGVFTGSVTTATPASGQEALIVPHGAAPSAPTNGSIWSTTAAFFARINGVTHTLLTLAGGTLTGLLTTVASATGTAGLNIPHGTAPTSPNNGDIWTTTAGLFIHVNGTTYQLASTVGATLTDPAITGAILEDIYTITDGAAFEIDPGNGSIQKITLGASRTPKATNMANGESVLLLVDDGTAYTLTWTDTTFGASGVKWLGSASGGGSAPTLGTTGLTWIVLTKYNSQVYGQLAGYSS